MMRRLAPLCVLLLLLVFVSVCQSANSSGEKDIAAPGSAELGQDQPSQIDISVDPRVELMSIIFRLAGNQEYNRGRIGSYTDDVDKHFAPFKKHAVVQTAVRLRKTYGVSYDAPMSMASHITDAFRMKERIPFEPHPTTLDARWKTEEARLFIRQAQQFVDESDFKGFYEEHLPLYEKSIENLEKQVVNDMNLAWFEEYFGYKSKLRYHVTVGMLNGPSNYGARIKIGEQEHFYSIVGADIQSEDGYPIFDNTYIPIIIHEFCHSYTNPVVDANLEELRGAGESIFSLAKDAMRRQAYGQWETMMYESMVRVVVIRYLYAQNGEKAEQEQIKSEVFGSSFIWMKQLSELMVEYEENRDKYKTIIDFYPKIIEFFNQYAEEIEEEFGDGAYLNKPVYFSRIAAISFA